MFRLSLLALIAGAGIGASATTPVTAAGNFDGDWRVLIVTEKGECDRAYAYEIRISGNALSLRERGGIDLDGKVSGSGHVTVTLRRGSQSAAGNGRIAQRTGGGTWEGKSPGSNCSGTWTAERH